METLYDWLFHYNPFTKLWAAFKREDLIDYFNGEYKNVIRSTSRKTLEELLITHNGDLEAIDSSVKK